LFIAEQKTARLPSLALLVLASVLVCAVSVLVVVLLSVLVVVLELLPPQAVRDSAMHRDSARAIHFFIFLVPPVVFLETLARSACAGRRPFSLRRSGEQRVDDPVAAKENKRRSVQGERSSGSFYNQPVCDRSINADRQICFNTKKVTFHSKRTEAP
jgi:cytochrome b561